MIKYEKKGGFIEKGNSTKEIEIIGDKTNRIRVKYEKKQLLLFSRRRLQE